MLHDMAAQMDCVVGNGMHLDRHRAAAGLFRHADADGYRHASRVHKYPHLHAHAHRLAFLYTDLYLDPNAYAHAFFHSKKYEYVHFDANLFLYAYPIFHFHPDTDGRCFQSR